MAEPGTDLDREFDELIRKGEAAYTEMYDCRAARLHDLCDDAIELLRHAAALATEAGRLDQARALNARCEHIRAVYWQLRT